MPRRSHPFAIGLFKATIGFSIGLDADIFRDVAAEASGAGSRLAAHLSQIGATGRPAWRRTSHKLGKVVTKPYWRRSASAQGFRGRAEGLRGVAGPKSKSPGEITPGLQRDGPRGDGGARPVLQAENAPMGGAVPPVAKKFGSRVGESQSHAKHELRRRRSILAKEKASPQSALDGGNLGKFSTEPFQNAAKCSSPSALFKHVISISSLNGLARKPTAPDASACARAFSPGKAVTKMIGK